MFMCEVQYCHVLLDMQFNAVVIGTVFQVESEHAGLRRICGAGVSVTRGAASAMMFAFSTLLLTMCRNHITYLRETFLHRFIPFDDVIRFHKYVAWWALIFTGECDTH